MSAPISSTQVTPIWNTTRPRVTIPTLRVVLPRPPSLSAPTTPARDDIQAGSRPEPTAATSMAATVKASTGASRSKRIQAGGGVGRLRMTADSQSTDTLASPIPRAQPMAARSRLSVSICRTSRARVAPSEERTASSRARNAARPNCMFITLTHAISSTPTQKPSMVRSVPRRGLGVKVTIRGCTCAVSNDLFVSGYAAAKRLAKAPISALAWSSETSRRRAPRTAGLTLRGSFRARTGNSL